METICMALEADMRYLFEVFDVCAERWLSARP